MQAQAPSRLVAPKGVSLHNTKEEDVRWTAKTEHRQW